MRWHWGRRIVRSAALAAAISSALAIGAGFAQAWTYKTLYQFTGGADGANPKGGLLRDPATGDLYGVASGGGDANCEVGYACGVVFRLSAAGQQTILHTFKKWEEGMIPNGGLVEDEAGNLYGTTAGGGLEHCNNAGFGCGVVFKLAAGGEYGVLHVFDTTMDGGLPNTRMVRDSVTGDLYGTAGYGSPFTGEIFKITADGQFSSYHPSTENSRGHRYC